MRRITVLLVALLAALALAAPAGAADHNGTFTASLKGRNEVADVDTNAAGNVIVKHRSGALSYKLIVANIDDVLASHIHCAPAGVNGPVGVTLFSGGPVTVDGILAAGEITAPDAGNACGWSTTADVVAAIVSGGAYVNVHTIDYPPGEIRGQLG